jgi:hypothetical protein
MYAGSLHLENIQLDTCIYNQEYISERWFMQGGIIDNNTSMVYVNQIKYKGRTAKHCQARMQHRVYTPPLHHRDPLSKFYE